MARKKIVWYGDAPTETTGLAKVSRYMLQGLQDAHYEVECLGIGHFGVPYAWSQHPYRIWPVYAPSVTDHDFRGRKVFLSWARGLQKEFRADVIVANLDGYWFAPINPDTGKPWFEDVAEALAKSGTKLVHYAPVDGPQLESWLGMSRIATVPLPYTDYAVREFRRLDPALADRCMTCGHGVDFSLYNRSHAAEGAALRKHLLPPGKKVMGLAVAANNTRKDWPRTFQIAKALIEQDPSFCLLCWTDPQGRTDISENMPGLVEAIGLKPDVDLIFPERDNQPEEFMPRLFHAADFYLSTSSGEGWGLSAHESMACGLPCVLPRVAAWEMIPLDCCFPIRSGDSPDLLRPFPLISTVYRPICSVESAVIAIRTLIDSPDLTRQIKEAAFEWVRQFTWKRAQREMVVAVEKSLRA